MRYELFWCDAFHCYRFGHYAISRNLLREKDTRILNTTRYINYRRYIGITCKNRGFSINFNLSRSHFFSASVARLGARHSITKTGGQRTLYILLTLRSPLSPRDWKASLSNKIISLSCGKFILLLVFNVYHILPFQLYLHQRLSIVLVGSKPKFHQRNKRLPLCSYSISPHQRNIIRANF